MGWIALMLMNIIIMIMRMIVTIIIVIIIGMIIITVMMMAGIETTAIIFLNITVSNFCRFQHLLLFLVLYFFLLHDRISCIE